MDRAHQLRRIAESYFDGLRDKKLAAIPYAAAVTLRAPLAPGGSAVPLVGRDAVHAYLTAILPAIQDVQWEDGYVNAGQTAVMGRAELTMVSGARLRVADWFEVDASGQITAQENHFDPRPALT